MSTIRIYANKSALVDKNHPGTNFSSGVSEAIVEDKKNLLIGFEEASSLAFKRLEQAELSIYIDEYGYKDNAWVYPLNSPFVENAATWNNKPPEYVKGGLWGFVAINDIGYKSTYLFSSEGEVALGLKLALTNGINVNSDNAAEHLFVATTRSSHNIYLDVDYGDVVNSSISYASPTSGYVPKHAENTFSWNHAEDGYSISEIEQTSATFYYRNGTSGQYTGIPCGTAQTITVPAETFTNNAIQWYVEATYNSGKTATSDVFTLSTEEVISTANAVSPSNTILDGSIANTFTWEHIISTGTEPTGADLQISDDDTTWSTLATVTGNALSTTIPANTITSGKRYWRVRTYNSDGIVSAWSDSATFISIAAPIIQGVTISNTPRPTVRWQSTDQKGFQVKIGSIIDSGAIYGTSNTWKSPVYLADGDYPVQVRVQNEYGLWSEWRIAYATINNTAGTSLSADSLVADGVVELNWNIELEYDGYVVYKDGKAISKTIDRKYTDNFALGSHEYFIRGIYNDSDNYGISNTLSVNVTVDNVWISAVDNPNWMPLYYSNIQTDEIRYSLSGDSRTYHVNGAAYPVVETSRFKNKYLSGRCAFMNRDEANTFEALTGRVVICKMPDGEMIVGALESVQKSRNEFYTGFTFSITHTAFDEDIVL